MVVISCFCEHTFATWKEKVLETSHLFFLVDYSCGAVCFLEFHIFPLVLDRCHDQSQVDLNVIGH